MMNKKIIIIFLFLGFFGVLFSVMACSKVTTEEAVAAPIFPEYMGEWIVFYQISMYRRISIWGEWGSNDTITGEVVSYKEGCFRTDTVSLEIIRKEDQKSLLAQHFIPSTGWGTFTPKEAVILCKKQRVHGYNKIYGSKQYYLCFIGLDTEDQKWKIISVIEDTKGLSCLEDFQHPEIYKEFVSKPIEEMCVFAEKV